jgi:hypothetical protein
MTDKKSNWDNAALDPKHPDNEAARKFLDLVMSPAYRPLRDPDPRMRDWRLYLAGWKAFAASQALGDASTQEPAQHAVCALSQQICEELRTEMQKIQDENKKLKRDLKQHTKVSPVGPYSCISCDDTFEAEDIVTLDGEFFPSTLDLTAGIEVVRITISLPKDMRELRKLNKGLPPTICKGCFHALLNLAAARMIERLRVRRHMEMWGPANGIDPARE